MRANFILRTVTIPIATMSWACTRSIFSTSPIQKSKFQPRWNSPFLNSYSLNEIVGAKPSIRSVFFSLRRCCSMRTDLDLNSITESADLGSKRQFGNWVDSSPPDKDEADAGLSMKTVLESLEPKKDSSRIKILSYNVWFREDLELQERMDEIGDLIHLHSPDIICFQEVTPDIYDIFQNSNWWRLYQCSASHKMAYSSSYFCMLLVKLKHPVKSFIHKPFSNTKMGRELCIAELKLTPHNSLVIATSHLESPCPCPPKWDQMYSKERVSQAKESINSLKDHPNVVFGGDMNWDDKLDGDFPLPEGWIDAWLNLRPEEKGYTYDTKKNKMISGNRTLQKRLDRFLCRLRDFRVCGIEMVGTEEIPGLVYCKEKKSKNGVKKLLLPVLPSDHYGLILTITKI